MRWSTTITMMFREHAFADRFAAARDAGFAGVEIQVMEDTPANAARAAGAAGIEVALLNLDMGDFLAGGPGLSGVPGREDMFRAAVVQGLQAAVLMDAGHVHIGPSRIPADSDRNACMAALRRNLDRALPLAQAAGVRLLLEPVNREDTPDALVGTLDEGLGLIADYDGQLGLQFDAYHAARNGEDPSEAFVRYRPYVAHVQFSDMPGRTPPGQGVIDYDRFFGTLRTAGYDGWAGAEYMAQGPTADTLDWLTRYG